MAAHGTPNLSGCEGVIEWPENTVSCLLVNDVIEFVTFLLGSER